MIVTPIAATQIINVPESIRDTATERTMRDAQIWQEGMIDELHEFAGRSCYQSWNKPNPKTANNEGYLAHIIDSQHESVLEHGSVTFYVEGVSRALTHELIRHRHLSFSELSQRYVDVSDAKFINPPALRDIWGDEDPIPVDAVEMYEYVVNLLVNRKGLKRKQAREAARAFMPNGVETRIVVTGNIRAWRYVIAKRYDPAADAEIQEFAGKVLEHLKEIAPNSVQDFDLREEVGGH